MDSVGGKVAAFIILLAFSAFFSSSESALFSLGRMRLRRLIRFGYNKYEAAEKLLQNPIELISTLLIGNEIVNTMLQIVAASLAYELLHTIVKEETLAILAVALTLPVLLFFGEIIPKAIGLRVPELTISKNVIMISRFYHFIAPIRKLLSWVPRLILKNILRVKTEPAPVSEDVLRSMLDESVKSGVVQPQEQRMIHNVFRLDDIKVNQIMTPRSQVSSMRSGTTLLEAFEQFNRDSYSRYPITDSEGQSVIGILYAKDLVGKSDVPQDTPIDNFLRQALIVSPMTHALLLFSQFKTFKMHFAVVVDSSSEDWIGVVTLEDVLEEIFGDIRDERDVDDEKRRLK